MGKADFTGLKPGDVLICIRRIEENCDPDMSCWIALGEHVTVSEITSEDESNPTAARFTQRGSNSYYLPHWFEREHPFVTLVREATTTNQTDT